MGDRQYRAATEADLDRLLEIHLAAYPDPRSVAARQRNFTQSPFGPLGDLVVVEERGVLVAHAFLFRLRAFFGGARVKVGGIGSVAVAPEARGRGVATALMEHLHALADRRGDAVTMLYAFRHGFYGQLGYATTSSRKRLALDPRSIPAAWRALARERVRGLRVGDDRVLAALYARAAERATGRVQRSKHLWEWLLTRESRTTLVAMRGKRASGYVAFTLEQTELYGPTFLEVEELVADDDETERALYGALGAMRDQVSEIFVEIAESDPLERVLLDGDGRRSGTDAVEHALGDVVGGPMIRLVDVERALGARGYHGSGSFDVEVDSSATWRVRVAEGRAAVTRVRSAGKRVVHTTRAGLAAVLYGALGVRDAVKLGLADAEPAAAAAIDAIVRLPPVTAIDAF